jgi:hypothetical protein
VISTDIDYKLNAFFDRLAELSINFSIVGVGGGGSNAARIFNRVERRYNIWDYDNIEVHNLPRLYHEGVGYLDKAQNVPRHNLVTTTNSKFDINTGVRTLAYSGVDYHDRQTVCDNENIMAVQVGFTDDKCLISVNPENSGIFSGDTYGLINTMTMMLNAYRGVEVFLDWFLALDDEAIESYFTNSTLVSEFSILDDENVVDKLYLEPLVKTPIIPEFIDYTKSDETQHIRVSDTVPSFLLAHSMEEEVKKMSVDTGSYIELIPMYPLSDSTIDAIDLDLIYSVDRYADEDDDDNYDDDDDDYDPKGYYTKSCFHHAKSEKMTGTLSDAVKEADYRLATFPDNFIGIMMVLDDATRINILHPLTVMKMKDSFTDIEGVYDFWIYSSERELRAVGDQPLVSPESILDFTNKVYAEQISVDVDVDEQDTEVDVDISTGRIIGVSNTYKGKYVLGIDTYILKLTEELPYYGYMLGNMDGDNTKYLTSSFTGNNSTEGDTCTGNADSSLFVSRHRQHKVNHSSVYFSSFCPLNEKHEIHASVNVALDIWFDHLNLNEE